MTVDVGGLHAGPAGAAGERFAVATLRGLDALGVRVVVVGGWALRMMGSPVPSIDLDVLVHERDWDRRDVYDFIDARTDTHREAHSDAYLEVHAIEWPRRAWSSKREYVPLDVLEADGTQLIEATVANRAARAEVPNPDGLAFMKAKAFGDRAAQYAATIQPAFRARLGDEAREAIEGVPPAFFLRKASKDLVDIAYLLAQGADARRVLGIASHVKMAGILRRSWMEVLPQVLAEARGLVRRHGMAISPDEALASFREAFGNPDSATSEL